MKSEKHVRLRSWLTFQSDKLVRKSERLVPLVTRSSISTDVGNLAFSAQTMWDRRNTALPLENCRPDNFQWTQSPWSFFLLLFYTAATEFSRAVTFPGTLGLYFEAQFPSDPSSVPPLGQLVLWRNVLRTSLHLHEGNFNPLASYLEALRTCFFVFRTGRGRNFDFTAASLPPVPVSTFVLRPTEKSRLKNRERSGLLKKKKFILASPLSFGRSVEILSSRHTAEIPSSRHTAEIPSSHRTVTFFRNIALRCHNP